jgi:Fe-S cluster biogenesis protein NfuA/nitrite reductase/ring-hydroxylating ferredoxin subunit
MTAPADVHEEELQGRVARIDRLVAELDALADPTARVVASEVIQAVLDLHREALDRMLGSIAADGELGDVLLAAFAADPLVGHTLLLHGLHPVDLRTRVESALESVRPYMRSHSGGVELLSVEGDAVRLRLEGSCHGCPSSAMTMRLAVEKAILEAAPDVASIEVEGVAEAPARPERRQLIPVAVAGNGHAPTAPSRARMSPEGWARLDTLTTLAEGEVRRIEVDGTALLACRLDEALYAYRARCPVCESAMWNAELTADSLVCPGCERAFDVRRAGRSAQTPYLLEAVPLLEEGTSVRVAIPAAVL